MAGSRDAMKIDALHIHLIRTNMRAKRAHGVGNVEHSVKRVILEVMTDQGVTGLGEAAPWEVFSGTAEAMAAALDIYLRPVLIGADPRRIPAIMAACDRALVGHAEAKAAVEMALFDIVGRSLGAPVSILLGGRMRERIPLSFSLANPDLDADLAAAQAMARTGHRIFKVKTGFTDHKIDLARLTALREELPSSVELRVDYNQGLEPWNALSKLRDVEQFRPGFIEQPVPRDARDVMAALTAALDTPVMADESVFSPAEMLAAAQQRLCDCVSIKLMKSGGMLKAREVAAIAAAAGIPGYGGTLWEGGIALAAGCHFIAATANVTLGCEFYAPRYAFERDVVTTPLEIHDGHIAVPDRPGLGMELDRDALKALTLEKR
jgi:muconate cycloisomerase